MPLGLNQNFLKNKIKAALFFILCSAMVGAMFLIYATDSGSKIIGCRTEDNDVMEVYANLITNTECAVRTIYSTSVYLNFQHNYVCLPLEKQVLLYIS